jgi:hypothetical protein
MAAIATAMVARIVSATAMISSGDVVEIEITTVLSSLSSASSWNFISVLQIPSSWIIR